MAITALPFPTSRFAPDRFERVLAAGAILLIVAVATALLRGRDEWSYVPWPIWAHLATIGVALALTPAMLLRPRGDRVHRTLGWIWSAALFLTAILSFGIRLSNGGRFSLIHLLSVWTLFQVPIIVWSARTHRVPTHRSAVRGMVTGALLIAGAFTFGFGRLLGAWLLQPFG